VDQRVTGAGNIDQLLRWTGDTTGHRVLGCRPHPASGRSRRLWIVQIDRPGRAEPLLLRSETGLGPFAGTPFTLVREARVLTALRRTPVPVPVVHGVTEDGSTMLLQLLPGQVAVDASTPAGRLAMTNYGRQLAELHQLDPTTVPLPQPVTPADHALLDLTAHHSGYRTHCPPSPLVDQTFNWLAEHAPDLAGRTSVLHGDAGPGNFLHRDGRITGLIDWEMTHVGDPHDDLAWLWFRIAVLGDGLGLGPAYRAYTEASGRPIDDQRVAYYRMAVLFRCLVATMVRQAHNPDSDPEPVQRMSRLTRSALSHKLLE
jgi:aminoglycoside phosphotransferase (APT) family kinase protein